MIVVFITRIFSAKQGGGRRQCGALPTDDNAAWWEKDR